MAWTAKYEVSTPDNALLAHDSLSSIRPGGMARLRRSAAVCGGGLALSQARGFLHTGLPLCSSAGQKDGGGVSVQYAPGCQAGVNLLCAHGTHASSTGHELGCAWPA